MTHTNLETSLDEILTDDGGVCGHEYVHYLHGDKSKIKQAILKLIESEIVRASLNTPVSPVRIGMLRQALNEDRITDPKKMIDNAYIEHWLGIKELDNE